MGRLTFSSQEVLNACRRIRRGYCRGLAVLLGFSLLTALVQLITDEAWLAAAPLILLLLWLLVGAVILLVWGCMRLYAARQQKREQACTSQQAAKPIPVTQPVPDIQPASSLAAGLPDIIPTVGDGWRDKALEGRRKADRLEGIKPGIYSYDWREKLIEHTERMSLRCESDLTLFQTEKEDGLLVYRMRERIGYYYIDVFKRAEDGSLNRTGWGPLSPHNVIRAAYPDHPEVIARVLACAQEEQRAELEHMLDNIMDGNDVPALTGLTRAWSDMLYLSREVAVLHETADGLELRFLTEHTPTLRNPDPRRHITCRWLSVSWEEIKPRREDTCLRLLRERNPLDSAWWIGKLAARHEFISLFRRPD